MALRSVIPKNTQVFIFFYISCYVFVCVWILDSLHWCGRCVQYCAEHGEGQQCRALFPLYTAAPDAYTQWLLGQVKNQQHRHTHSINYLKCNEASSSFSSHFFIFYLIHYGSSRISTYCLSVCDLVSLFLNQLYSLALVIFRDQRPLALVRSV